jgi:hypothetical protein
MASSKGRGGPLPPVVASERVAAILAEGSAATSPPKLPVAMASRLTGAGAGAGAGALPSAREAAAGPLRVDSSAYTAPGGRLRIGPDGVPLKFSLLAQRAAASAATRAAAAAAAGAPPDLAGGLAATSVLAAATQRAAAGAGERGAQVDAVLAHQLVLLTALVGPREAAALELADLYARRAQPTLLAEAAKTLLSPSDDIEARHGLAFLEL